MEYVIYDITTGALEGSYSQDLLPEHSSNYIEVDSLTRENWTNFKYDPLSKKLVQLILEPSPPIILPVSPRQIRQALTRTNLRQPVEAAIASADQDTKDWYEFATEFVRTNPHVIAMGQSLNVSEVQLDDLWRLAGSL